MRVAEGRLFLGTDQLLVKERMLPPSFCEDFEDENSTRRMSKMASVERRQEDECGMEKEGGRGWRRGGRGTSVKTRVEKSRCGKGEEEGQMWQGGGGRGTRLARGMAGRRV